MTLDKVTAVVISSGDWFAVEVPEVGGLFTQASRLDEVEGMVRDAAKMLGVEIGTVLTVFADSSSVYANA